MTNSEWVTLYNLWKAVSSYDQQRVSDIAHFVKSLITSFLWPTACEWYWTICERQSHHIFSYEQEVGDIAHFVKGSLITSFTNSMWGTSFTFCERQSHHIFSYDQQSVSDIAHVVKNSLITSFLIINSKWVTLHILWTAVSSHLSLWPTGGQLHCMFKCSLVTYYFPMINSLWVTLHILWKAVSSHLSYDQWQSVSDIGQFEKDISSYNEQEVSGKVAHFVIGSLITPSPWPTACEWHCIFCWICWSQSHHIFPYDQQRVSDIAHLWKAVTVLSLWPTGSEWHWWLIWERQSHQIFSHDQQLVSDIAYIFCERQSHCIFSYDQQRVSGIVTMDILLKAVSSHCFLWQIACELRHCTFCERQSHYIFSYDQQRVGDIIACCLWMAVSSHLFL